MVSGIPLFWFNLLSLTAGFILTLALVWKSPKSILILVALAVALFILFGIFAIPGFLLALGAKVFLAGKRETTPPHAGKEKKGGKRR